MVDTSTIEKNLIEQLEEGHDIGSILVGERMTSGKSLEDVYQDLRIKPDVISAIESNRASEVPNMEYLPGTVRSYAKYLGLPADIVVDAFKKKNGFDVKLGSKNIISEGVRSSTPWDSKENLSSKVFTGFKFLGTAVPLMLVASIVFGLGYGVYFALGKLQGLDVVPVDSRPKVASQSIIGDIQIASNDSFQSHPTINYDELYKRQALNVPIVVMRDGPIASVDPEQGGVFGSREIAVNSEVPATATAIPVVGQEPTVAVGLLAPTLELVPLSESWVQLKTEDNQITFEKLLKAGEVYSMPLEGAINFLKAGNASQLYVRLSGKLYGPIGQDGTSVVRNVPMIPTELEVQLAAVEAEELIKLTEAETTYMAKLASQ